MSNLVLPSLRRVGLRNRPLYQPLLYRAQYHSYQHPPPPSPYNTAETSILAAALEHVPNHGFSNTALTNGARDAGYLDISVNLFPRGPLELARYHLMTERLGLHKRVEFGPRKDGEAVGGELGVGQKIRRLCVERLRANEKIVGRWQEVSQRLAQWRSQITDNCRRPWR